jgi:glycosyltransferase involved in cell wall biosynthesis
LHNVEADTLKIANIHYSGFGGVAAVVNGMVSAPGAEAQMWIMGYYGVAPLDASNKAFCEAHNLRYATFRPQPGRPWSAWRQLARWLNEERPDAILCHSITAIPPCAYHARKNQVPFVAVEHTPNEVKSRTEWAGSFAAMILADRVVVLTKVYAELLRKGLGNFFISDKVRIIQNGVDVGLYRPRSEIKIEGTPLGGMAARVAHTKRHDLLIDIAKDTFIALKFAGNGECLHSLKKRAMQSEKARVEFNGLVPANEMPNWLADLDMYLHASDGETASMSVLQAMATGLPIIASDISGMEEIIGRDGQCGLLVKNNRQAWRDAVELLSRNAELRQSMGKAARERVERDFSTTAMLEGYLSVIKELVSMRVRRSRALR